MFYCCPVINLKIDECLATVDGGALHDIDKFRDLIGVLQSLHLNSATIKGRTFYIAPFNGQFFLIKTTPFWDTWLVFSYDTLNKSKSCYSHHPPNLPY